MKVFEAMAEAFVAEGTDAVFGLMGDGNMYWMSHAGRKGARLIHARHENAAVAMADGYARVTGRVGVASVTSGPGLTQIATSLTASVRHGTPMVVFTGDTPVAATFNLQEFDQSPFVASCGAGFLASTQADRASDDVALAFYRARHERRPIVLSVPWDVQELTFPWDLDHDGSDRLLPPAQRLLPDPDAVAAAVEAIRDAERPIVLAGAGAIAAGAHDLLVELGRRTGALLATTVRAKGWFDGDEWNAGICGAFSSESSRELFAEADLVIGVGARLGYFTTEAGYLFPMATIVQVDREPVGYVDGQRVADLFVRGDAAHAALALLDGLGGSSTGAGYRTDATAATLARPRPADAAGEVPAGTVDPRLAMREVDAAVPKDWRVVIGAGHFWNFAVAELTGRHPWSYVYTYDFGVIGQGLPTALGAVVADLTTPTVLIEGDGSLLMNVQELETVARHRIPLLVLVSNDGAYGAEVHKMRAKGFTDDEAVFGPTALDHVAAAFGVRARRVDGEGQLAAVVAEFAADPAPTVVDVRVAPDIMADTYRRLYYGEA